MSEIEDRLAVGDVIIKYADSVDQVDYDRYASCFTDDVVVTGFTPEPISTLAAYMPWLRKCHDWRPSKRACCSRCSCEADHVHPSRSKFQFSGRWSQRFNHAKSFNGKTLLGSFDRWKAK